MRDTKDLYEESKMFKLQMSTKPTFILGAHKNAEMGLGRNYIYILL